MAPRKLTVLCGALGLAFAMTIAVVRNDAAPPARAADITLPPVPKAALLATHPGAELTSLFFVDVRGGTDLAPVATFGHLPDATVRAAVVPGKSDILATADVTPSRDASFNAGLFYLQPHKPPQQIVDQIVHASRPLVTAAGRIFVSRGKPGKEIEGRMRIDYLTIDEIDLGSGRARTVHRAEGYLLYLAGALEKEIVVYRIFPGRADIVAIDPDTSKERILVKDLPAYARDFSIDAQNRALVFQNRDENSSGTWVVERLDLKTLQKQRLFADASMTLSPFVLPQGGVLYNPPGHGLSALDARVGISGPLGAGVDVVAASTKDGRFLAALHTQPSSFAVPFVVDTQSGAARVLPAPANTRVVVAGFITEGGAQ